MRIKVTVDSTLPITYTCWALRTPDGWITAAGIVVRPDMAYAGRVRLAAEWCELLAAGSMPAVVGH